jgi:hypothetical protein
MAEIIHLVVEKGADKGKKITVPQEGGRLGRSSKNDIVLTDPLLSRHHCRLFFKTGDGLWITDLGSSNQTLVNNVSIQETRLRVGDIVTIGDTSLRTIHDGITDVPPPPPAKKVPPKPAATKPVVDLGLDKSKDEPKKKIPWGPILFIEALVVLGVTFYFVNRSRRHPRTSRPQAVQPVREEKKTLAIEYEKVQASPNNIFRHKLQITKDASISVQIDDIQNNRHVRKEKAMDKGYCQNLAQSIIDAGFFTLDERYEGIQPDILDSYDLSVTIGNRTHRTRVVNRVEPDAFKNIREMVEECGKNELGLEAIQFSTDKLLTMAQDAYLLGQKLYDEREIKFGNLFSAIKSLKETEMYLDTVEPKPDYYAALRNKITDYTKELDGKFADQDFRVRRAINMRDWEEASKELRILLDMIPDRSDPRNIETQKKILDVDNRLNERK